VKVARGGQVNLTFHGQTVEYVAPELFLLQGRDEKVEVVVSRRDLSSVKVIYRIPGGTAECVAAQKELLEWGEDRQTISARLRCIATVKRVLKRGLKSAEAARYLLADAAGMPTTELVRAAQDSKLIDAKQAFGAPAPNGTNEISGAEYTMQKLSRSKPRFSSDVVAKALELEDEEPA
jgi:hypothetical protein